LHSGSRLIRKEKVCALSVAGCGRAKFDWGGGWLDSGDGNRLEKRAKTSKTDIFLTWFDPVFGRFGVGSGIGRRERKVGRAASETHSLTRGN
jgi:hypothetical protein